MPGAREKILFGVSLLVFAGLGFLKLSDGYQRARVPAVAGMQGEVLASPAHVKLRADLLGDRDDENRVRRRSSFAPPRELLPLEPLLLPAPPIPRLSVLAPRMTPVAGGDVALDDRLAASSLGGLSLGAGDAGRLSSGVAGQPGADADSVPESEQAEAAVDPELRFDWLARVSMTRRVYGRILNGDPLGLGERSAEDLVFQDVSLRTGGSVGVPYSILRSDVLEFGFARNFENTYQLESRSLGSGPGAVRARMELSMSLLASAGREARGLEFALAEARLALEAGRRDNTAARLVARLCARVHDVEGELAVYRSAVDGAWIDDALMCDYARFVLNMGLPERASELVEQARRLRPVSAEVRGLTGEMLLSAGQVEQALVMLRSADQVPFQPPFEDLQRTQLVLTIGRAELAAGRAREALRAAQRVLLNEPGDVGALALSGSAHAALQNLEAAAAAYAEAIAAEPGDGELLRNAGLVAWRQGDGAAARRLLLRAIDQDPLNSAAPLLALGFLHEDAGQPEAARELYAEALSVSPASVDGLYRMGRHQRLAGDTDSAGTTLRSALRLGGPELLLLSELGRAAMERDEPALATRYFREALRLEPENPEVLWLKGLAELQAGDLSSALESLDRATIHGAEGAHVGLGVALYQRGDAGDVDAALDHLDEVERAFAGRPESAQAAYASAQAVAIRDNLAKRQWVDGFGRSSLQRGWTEQQWEGSPRVLLLGEGVNIQGRMERPRTDEQPGIARVLDGRGFVSVGASMQATVSGDSRFGLALTYRQVKGQRGRLPKARLEIWVDSEGLLRLSALDNFDTVLLDSLEVPGIRLPTGGSVRLGVERLDDVTGRFQFLVDGRAVGEPVALKSLRNFKSMFDLEVFGDAAPGRSVDVTVHDVRIVRLL